MTTLDRQNTAFPKKSHSNIQSSAKISACICKSECIMNHVIRAFIALCPDMYQNCLIVDANREDCGLCFTNNQEICICAFSICLKLYGYTFKYFPQFFKGKQLMGRPDCFPGYTNFFFKKGSYLKKKKKKKKKKHLLLREQFFFL